MGSPDTGPEPTDALLGRKAVELGLITEIQLRDVQARLAHSAAPGSLSATLLEVGLLTKRQLDDLRNDTAAVRKKFGKYTIVRQLGRGGMGVVFEAIDADLGRHVALKMLLPANQADPAEAAREEERFVREARMSANLPKHPGIVGVYESGTMQSRRYIAMEYIDGCHFGEWCKKSTGSLRTQVAILRDAAVAVDHANRHGIIHRDLKPANILVDVQGRAHVTDFGLARQSRVDSSLTLTGGGKVMGTPAYISPEQASGRRNIDRRTDVWSLGVMLYELLTGAPPFKGDSPIDIMMKTVQNTVPPPSAAAKTAGRRPVDKAIENICLKALAKSPKDRYPNAKQFAHDLTQWLNGGIVEATAPKEPSHALRYGMAAALAAGVIALAVVVFSPSSSPEAEAAQRRNRAEELVMQGRRHLADAKPLDALVAFGQARKLDPSNAAATAGALEAERRLKIPPTGPAETTAKAPVRPPVAPPTPPPAKDPIAQAKEFARANPKDLQGQIRVWQEASQTAGLGSPGAAEALRELEALQLRLKKATSVELEVIDRALKGLNEGENYGAARDVLAQAANQHDEVEWQNAVRERRTALEQAVAAAFAPIRDLALEARKRGNPKAVEAHRSHVAKWNCPELSTELDEALSRVAAPAPPSPEPSSASAVPELAGLLGHGSGVSAAAFSPDGKYLLSASFDNTVRLWTLATRTEKLKLVEGILPRSVAFSPDNKWMAAGLIDGSVKIWDLANLHPRTLTGHTVNVAGLSFSPDSTTLASSSADGSVRLWDCAAGLQKQQLSGHSRGAMSLAWSPDGKLLAVGCVDKEIKLWEMPAGRERRSLTEGIRGATACLTFSASGKNLCSSGEDPAVIVWDVESGSRRELTGHAKDIRSACWSPDGKWIAATSGDGSIRVWDASSGETRAVMTDASAFFGSAFSRKGDMLAGGTGSGSIRIWDMTAFRPAKGPK